MKLHLLTANYPYGFGESYLNNELPFLIEEFDELVIYPKEEKGNIQAAFDARLKVEYDNHREESVKLGLSDHIFLVKLLMTELINMDKKVFFIRNVRKFFALLRQACKLSIWLEDQGLEKSDAFYSYWMNEWALALTILKKRRKINKFIFRVNGYDIWNERHAGNYLPFRYLIYSQTEKVIALSESSEKYIKDLNIFPDKIEKCYFGTKDFGELEERERDEYVIFSCSSAIPLKRLDKIAKVICSLDFKVTWHHHGDGLTMTEVNKIMTAAPENVSFINTKKVDDYFEVLQMQKKMAPDLVINLSSTEGLPVTLIEAISFGIPILANNVGSCYEIANQTTGVIVKKEASIQEIAAEIKGLKLSGRAQKERSIIRDYWLKNFSDEKIYGSFAKDIKIIFK